MTIGWNRLGQGSTWAERTPNGGSRSIDVSAAGQARPTMNSITYSSILSHADQSITGAALRQVCGQVRCGLQGAQPHRAQEQGGQSECLPAPFPSLCPPPSNRSNIYICAYQPQESIDVLMKRFYTMPLPKGGGVVHVSSQQASKQAPPCICPNSIHPRP